MILFKSSFRKGLALFYLLTLKSIVCFTQTTTIDFEIANNGYTPSTTNGSGWMDVFNRTNHNMTIVTNEDGYYWACEDLAIINPSIDLDQINITGASSFNFSIDMLAHHYDDWDASDELRITYSIDGGPHQNLMWVQSMVGSGTNTPAGIDLAFDGDGDCGATTTLPSRSFGTETSSGCTVSSSNFATFTTLEILLLGNNTLDIKLEFLGLDAADEGIYIDNIIIVQTSGAAPTWNGSSSNSWFDPSNWDHGMIPIASDDVVIPNVAGLPNAPIVDNSGAVCNSLTIQDRGVLTIIDPSANLKTNTVELQPGGGLDIQGGEIECTGKMDFDGVLIMTDGLLDINGEMELSSSANGTGIDGVGVITVEGEWDGANASGFLPAGGTVILDAASSDINLELHASAYFHHLTISTGALLEVDCNANLDINGSLSITSGILDLGTANSNLNIAGNYINSGGILSTSAETITFDGSGVVTATGHSDNTANLIIAQSGGSVETTGDWTLNDLTVTAGTFLIDGETVESDHELFITGGTLQLNSGLLFSSSPTSNDFELTGGTLDVNGGEVRVGDVADEFADILLTSGTIDVAGGTVNINDELDLDGGTFNQSGGTVWVCKYSDAQDGTNVDKFSASATSSLNFTGGDLKIGGQSNSTYNAINIHTDATVTSSSSHTITFQQQGSATEDFYIDLNGNALNSNIIFNSTGITNYIRENTVLGANFSLLQGTFDLAALTVSVDGATDIDGALLIATGEFEANGFDATGGVVTFSDAGFLAISGASPSFGTFTSSMSTVEFDGSSAQSIEESISFYNLKINNTSGLTLNATTDVTNQLILTNGDIISDPTNKLTIKVGATISEGSDGSHIVGPMDYETAATTEITLPVGDGTRYRPVFILPATATASTWTARYYNSTYNDLTCAGGDIDHVAPGIYWDVSNNLDEECTMGLSWNSTILVDVPADMVLAHWDDQGSTWEKINAVTQTQTGSNGSGSALPSDGRVSAFVDAYSPFNLGSGSGNNPLPIDLLSFTADCSDDLVNINFSVISQVNNDYFIIERSVNALEWEELTLIEGAGNTNAQMDYIYSDNDPIADISYYRLRQVDYNGVSEIFYPVSVSCDQNEAISLELYPNPVVNDFTFEIELDEFQGNNVYYTILDTRGLIVKRDRLVLDRGFNRYQLNIADLPTGLYIFKFENTKVHIPEQRIIKK